jgi:hypothetical protein
VTTIGADVQGIDDGTQNHMFLAVEDWDKNQWIIDATYKQFLANSLDRAQLNGLPDVMAINVTNKKDIESQLASHGIADSLRHIWMNSLVL